MQVLGQCGDELFVGWGLFTVWEMLLPNHRITIPPGIMDGAPDCMLHGAPVRIAADPCNIGINLFDDALRAVLRVTRNGDAYLLVSDTVSRKSQFAEYVTSLCYVYGRRMVNGNHGCSTSFQKTIH